MKFFDGLYSYEVVLLALGVILFLVAVILLVVLVIRGRPFGQLLGFFVIPIVMIGYPSIKSFQFSQGVIQIKTDTRQLHQNPRDLALRAKLTSEVDRLSPRPSSSASTVAAIAHAQVALGNNDAARAYIKNALSRLPNNEQVVSLQRQLEAPSAKKKN